MIGHQIFAQIYDTAIKNIIVCDNYELANQLARMIYGDSASAWECTQYPVSIGDKCINRVFYFKDGVTQVPRTPTAEESVTMLTVENTDLKSQVNNLTIALAEMMGV